MKKACIWLVMMCVMFSPTVSEALRARPVCQPLQQMETYPEQGEKAFPLDGRLLFVATGDLACSSPRPKLKLLQDKDSTEVRATLVEWSKSNVSPNKNYFWLKPENTLQPGEAYTFQIEHLGTTTNISFETQRGETSNSERPTVALQNAYYQYAKDTNEPLRCTFELGITGSLQKGEALQVYFDPSFPTNGKQNRRNTGQVHLSYNFGNASNQPSVAGPIIWNGDHPSCDKEEICLYHVVEAPDGSVSEEKKICIKPQSMASEVPSMGPGCQSNSGPIPLSYGLLLLALLNLHLRQRTRRSA